MDRKRGRSSSTLEVQAVIRMSASHIIEADAKIYPSVDFITGGRVAFSRAQVGNDSDIIAVVGRGVASTFPPITCDATEEIASQRSQAIAEAKPGTNDTALETLYGLAKDLGRDCGRVTPDLVPYAGTFYVAKDMNHVLQALKQDKISYL